MRNPFRKQRHHVTYEADRVMSSGVAGRAVIGGREFPIDSVSLERGVVLVQIRIEGPQSPFGGNITVFGCDGSGQWQGKYYEFPHIERGCTWYFEYCLTITEVTSAHEVKSFRIGDERYQ